MTPTINKSSSTTLQELNNKLRRLEREVNPSLKYYIKKLLNIV